MSRKAPQINEHQGLLLQELTDHTYVPATTFPSDPGEKLLGEPKPEMTITYGVPGTYVDLAERAEHLDASLAAFGHRNQRLGFDYASNVRRHNGPIYGRYRNGVAKVQEGAQANSDRFLDDAKRSFWQATGYTALRGHGLGSDTEIDAEGRKLWREFSEKYGDPNKRPIRDKYRKTLARTAKIGQKVLKRSAA